MLELLVVEHTIMYQKQNDKAIKGILMGFAPNEYRIWNPEKRCIIISRDVSFDTHLRWNPSYSKQNEGRDANIESSSSDTESDQDQENESLENVSSKNMLQENTSLANENQIRRSTRIRKHPIRCGFDENCEANSCILNDVGWTKIYTWINRKVLLLDQESVS